MVLPAMKLTKHEKNDVIYSLKKEVRVVLVGDMVLMSHKKHFTPSKLYARYQEGDIIGYKTEGSEPDSIHNWCITRCMTILGQFSYDDFTKIWRVYQNKVGYLNMVMIRCCTLLQNCSDISILKLHDCIERRIYKAGSMICPQSKNSPINFDYIQYHHQENLNIPEYADPNGSNLSTGRSEGLSPFKKAVSRIHRRRDTQKLMKIIQQSHDLKPSSPKIQNRPSSRNVRRAVNRVSYLHKPTKYFDSSVVNFDFENEGVHIITKGKCEVINRIDKYLVTE